MAIGVLRLETAVGIAAPVMGRLVAFAAVADTLAALNVVEFDSVANDAAVHQIVGADVGGDHNVRKT
jgi:hypothetical protein